MSIEQWALVAGAIAILLAVAVWPRWRAARRRRIPRFEGKLGNLTKNREFIDFLTKNRHRRIRLDVWLDDSALAGAGQRSAEEIRLVAPNDDPKLDDECEITIHVDDRENSPLSQANGVWRLNGYVAIEGRMGVWQGIPSYRLVAMPHRAAAR
ncbi:MAG TPA: hypothetical protein VGP26_32285 [Actinophytocola sp.]|nr:hypothetical protein [Actinophytocola sp.]